VADVLDEFSANPAQLSRRTGPPVYIGWNCEQYILCSLAGRHNYSAAAGLAESGSSKTPASDSRYTVMYFNCTVPRKIPCASGHEPHHRPSLLPCSWNCPSCPSYL
jgi:hypothetical protein